MFVVHSLWLAVLFCIVTMLCWGSWANTQKLVGQRWRFELFYWDYVFGMMLAALVFAFTMGNIGGDAGRGFVTDLLQADGSSLGMAFLGGVIFNAANILLVAAIAISGMSVAFPVGIGIALVWGVVVNYDATTSGQPFLLFLGVAGVVAAIVINAIAYRKLPNQKQGHVVRGLILAVLCGVMMGNFYWCVAGSMDEKFTGGAIAAGKLSSYTAMVLFSLGVVCSQVAYNFSTILKWFTGEELTRPEYFAGTGADHLWGVLGGVIWAIGMTLNLVASPVASPAVSYGLGQGATLVAALWGVFIWREFDSEWEKLRKLIWAMFIAFGVGLFLIVLAKVVSPAKPATDAPAAVESIES